MKKQLLTFLSSVFLATTALATEFKAFTQSEFDSLMQQGKPVLVHIHADWCTTCKRQLHVLEPALKEEKFANLTALKVDYDTQDDVLKAFKVNRQSTLIMFDQGKEVRRAIAETNAEKLVQFITLP
ncbi:thiol reductase thioredoxin [Pasteurellaceae bacterium Orientalotternb1]|nr:thiol reductase thioredoxin [Pasteurellaceae bacterium Orientalotternb1]